MTSRRIPILMYHSVSEKTSPGFAPFAVMPSAFQAQMKFLADQGYTALTVSQLIQAYAEPATLPTRPIVLTFDDGFADFQTDVLPVLLRRAMRATLYIVSGRVGGSSTWLEAAGEGSRPLLGWPALRDVHHAGVEIGAHTVTHPQLDRLALPEAAAEIGTSKARIEQKLGHKVESFAYPFGFENARVRAQVRAAGFTSACAVRYAASTPTEDRFALSRHIVRRSADLAAFARIVTDTVPPLTLAVDRTRSRAFAALRPILNRVRP